MTSVAQRVYNHLKGDLILADALHRGVLNNRRTARWLLEEHEWDATEEAVVSALRRYEPDSSRATVHDAHRHLAQARVNVEPGLAIATYPRIRELQRRVQSFWWKANGEDVLGLMSKQAIVHFILSKDTVGILRDVLGPDGLTDVHHPVAEVRISLQRNERVAPLSAAIMLNVLGHKGITVLDIAGCQPDTSILIPGSEGPAAYRAATEFIESLPGTEDTTR